VIADALPNDPEWLEWKKWLVVTQLLEMQDEQACRSVMYYSGRTLEDVLAQGEGNLQCGAG
jgi:hypothetical protein